jgi:hypothetical protein
MWQVDHFPEEKEKEEITYPAERGQDLAFGGRRGTIGGKVGRREKKEGREGPAKLRPCLHMSLAPSANPRTLTLSLSPLLLLMPGEST